MTVVLQGYNLEEQPQLKFCFPSNFPFHLHVLRLLIRTISKNTRLKLKNVIKVKEQLNHLTFRFQTLLRKYWFWISFKFLTVLTSEETKRIKNMTRLSDTNKIRTIQAGPKFTDSYKKCADFRHHESMTWYYVCHFS